VEVGKFYQTIKAAVAAPAKCSALTVIREPVSRDKGTRPCAMTHLMDDIEHVREQLHADISQFLPDSLNRQQEETVPAVGRRCPITIPARDPPVGPLALTLIRAPASRVRAMKLCAMTHPMDDIEHVKGQDDAQSFPILIFNREKGSVL
jgi:hypothetical protein